MDGYAVRAADVVSVPATLRCVGSAAAGGAFAGPLQPGEAVRIFTGAPVPTGADAIVIQEDTAADGDRITIREAVSAGRYVRPAGLDFTAGTVGVSAGRELTARDIGLAAAMNRPWVAVRRRPRVAILGTGDEIVRPGEPIGPNQIVSSNGFALAAMVRACGGEPVDLGIAPDRLPDLEAMIEGAAGADLLVTTGGASVGDHDLVQAALKRRGLSLDFWQIAMRPGKPLMHARLAGPTGGLSVLGLPGNPVSTVVCGLVFLRPALRRLQGLEPDGDSGTARLGAPLAANDRRQDYLRATITRDEDGTTVATAFPRQDSSMLSLIAKADCLVIRPPLAPPVAAGASVNILPFPPGI
jgi:molybdopterin molybdotransferase